MYSGGLLLCVNDLALCEEAEQTLLQEESDIQESPPTLDSHGSASVTPEATGMTRNLTFTGFDNVDILDIRVDLTIDVLHLYCTQSFDLFYVFYLVIAC